MSVCLSVCCQLLSFHLPWPLKHQLSDPTSMKADSLGRTVWLQTKPWYSNHVWYSDQAKAKAKSFAFVLCGYVKSIYSLVPFYCFRSVWVDLNTPKPRSLP